MNLISAIETFLLSQPNLGTRKAYKSCLIPMRDYIGPSRPIEDVEISDLVKYANQLHNHPTYAPATIRKHVISIKAFFNWLKKFGIITASPADAIKRPKVPRNIDRKKAMDEAHLTKLLEWSQFSPRHDALVRFLADTGCRIGGAHTLKLSDINFEKNIALVTEKGDKSRMVAFGQTTHEALKRWINARADDACEYVFATGDKNLQVANLAQLFRRACIASGIGSYGPHSLRHRKGYQLSDNKTSLAVAATVLGHESTETTLHYYPRDWERAEAALRELSLEDSNKRSPKIVNIPNRRVE